MWRIFGHYVSKILILVLLGDLAVLTGAAGLVHGGFVEVGGILFGPDLNSWISPNSAPLPRRPINFQARRRSGELIARILLASLCAAVAIVAISYALPWLSVHRIELLSIIGFFTLGLISFRTIIDRLGANKRLQKRVLVLGTGLAAPIISYEGSHTGMPFRGCLERCIIGVEPLRRHDRPCHGEGDTPMARPAPDYTTDLTDEEWQILEPLLPPERPAVDPANTRCGRCSMASSMCCAAAVPGA